ncbi:hypothetical protein [Rhizobium sp. BK376]|nr:hypothetical protein [Rhizobium sp. BK376]TCR82280.1 hypothetical protein EV561_111185 [Rhizobium sp. BK376]
MAETDDISQKPTLADALREAGFAPCFRERIIVTDRANREPLKRRD